LVEGIGCFALSPRSKSLCADIVLICHSPCVPRTERPGGGHINMPGYPDPNHTRQKNSATNPRDLPVVRKTLWMVSKLSTRTFQSQTHRLDACGKKRPGYENQPVLTPSLRRQRFHSVFSQFPENRLSLPLPKVEPEGPPFGEGDASRMASVPLRNSEASASSSSQGCEARRAPPPRAASSRRSTCCRRAKQRPPRPDRRTFLLPRTTMWQGRDFR
jgi:hypothetical protein